MLDILVVLIAVFFLPGFLLVNFLYPRKGELDREYDIVYRITLGMVMSVVIVIIIGFVLNALGRDPSTGKGYFRAEIIWPLLLFLSIFFFLAGWFRGAYPILGKIHPSLLRFPRREPQSVIMDIREDKETVLAFRELSERRERIHRQIKNLERRVRLQTGEMKKRSERRLIELQKELEETDKELTLMEEKRASELY